MPSSTTGRPANLTYGTDSYHANDGKLEALNRRFRDHTHRIFRKHGIKVVGFWVPQEEKDGKSNTLIYMLAFPSREAAAKAWADFSADPEWKMVRAESERDGSLVKKVDSVFMNLTDYSPRVILKP